MRALAEHICLRCARSVSIPMNIVMDALLDRLRDFLYHLSALIEFHRWCVGWYSLGSGRGMRKRNT